MSKFYPSTTFKSRVFLDGWNKIKQYNTCSYNIVIMQIPFNKQKVGLMKFRKDINGLRAFAVIAVVLFHFNSSWMPGGFAGVDVFFVISGFLMTSIIFRGIEQNSFSVIKFYVARANRIIPALGLLCVVMMIFGWFYLTPIDYKILSKHAATSIGFLSNFAYWSESGYFDTESLGKWLLHTWTLSVEWQFYIIYPLILVSISKFLSIKTMKRTLLIGTVLGFAFCVYSAYKWPHASYFLLPTRAWEMLIGGVAYLYPFTLRESRKKIVECMGIVLVISSYFFISEENPWPGYLALLPAGGAFLVIQAQRYNSLITSNIVFQKLGNWSYSIYLWHWPIVVGIYYFSLPKYSIYLGMALSVFFGFLSYKYIEKIKFRNNFTGLFSYLKHKPIYIVLVVGMGASLVFLQGGVPQRFTLSASEQLIVDELVMPSRKNGYCFYDSRVSNAEIDKNKGTDCYLGNKEKSNVKTLLFGDSYAGHIDPFLDEILKANNSSFQSISTSSCYPAFSNRYPDPLETESYEQCLLNRSYLEENIHNYENIVFAGSWGEVLEMRYFNDIEELIYEAAKNDVNIFILAGPYQYQKNPLNITYRNIYFDSSATNNDSGDSDVMMKKANIKLKKLTEKYENVYFIDRTSLYEDDNTFELGGLDIPYSADGGHISILGAKQSAQHFMRQDEYKHIIKQFNF